MKLNGTILREFSGFIAESSRRLAPYWTARKRYAPILRLVSPLAPCAMGMSHVRCSTSAWLFCRGARWAYGLEADHSDVERYCIYFSGVELIAPSRQMPWPRAYCVDSPDTPVARLYSCVFIGHLLPLSFEIRGFVLANIRAMGGVRGRLLPLRLVSAPRLLWHQT